MTGWLVSSYDAMDQSWIDTKLGTETRENYKLLIDRAKERVQQKIFMHYSHLKLIRLCIAFSKKLIRGEGFYKKIQANNERNET